MTNTDSYSLNTVEIDNKKINYYRVGHGKPIILLPGIFSDCDLWNGIIPALKDKFEIFAFSLPIYETRNSIGHVYTLRTYYKFVAKLIKKFKIKDPILIGHSMGGLISLVYASKHPQSIKKLLLVSCPLTDHKIPPPTIWTMLANLVTGGKFMRKQIYSALSNDELVDIILRLIIPEKNIARDMETVHSLLGHLPVNSLAHLYLDILKTDLKKYVTRIKTPTLLVYGSRDAVLTELHGTTLYSQFPNAKVIELPSEHYIPSDMPKELTDYILKFINSGE